MSRAPVEVAGISIQAFVALESLLSDTVLRFDIRLQGDGETVFFDV